jgi:hypothetical protein
LANVSASPSVTMVYGAGFSVCGTGGGGDVQ